ncbi:MAG: division plane positioning ATPase MipZ, partial [Pseudomonadota bacterium]
MTAGARGVISPAGAHVIVVGAEKQAAGKTTIALHLITALARLGHKVRAVDLDAEQRTLSRFFAAWRGDCVEVFAPDDAFGLTALHQDLPKSCTYWVIDTPCAESALARAAHASADTLVTALTDGAGLGAAAPGASLTPSAYSEMVWESRKQKARARGGPIDWVVLHNRALNARALPDLGLIALSARIGFRVAPGLSERPVLRDLLAQRRTLFDAADGL